MTLKKIQRIEFLLGEIQEILHTMEEDQGEQSPKSQQTPEVSRLSNGIPLAEASSRTDSESQQSSDTDSLAGSSIAAEQDIPDLCVRCFNTWEAHIQSGRYEIPDCEWDEGRGRKKCRYCSSRRSECVKVPASICRGILRRKAELYQATLDEDLTEIGRKQKRFNEAYFTMHARVRATVSSEERRRRRQRAALQREKQRKENEKIDFIEQ